MKEYTLELTEQEVQLMINLVANNGTWSQTNDLIVSVQQQLSAQNSSTVDESKNLKAV